VEASHGPIQSNSKILPAHRGGLAGKPSGVLGQQSLRQDEQTSRRADGRIEVEGPLAGPFKKTEELAAHACDLMTRQPGADARHGKHGVEYCALHYYAAEEDTYYLSYLSDIGGDGAGGSKFCKVPSSLHDLKRGEVIITGPAHTHSINIKMSDIDLGSGRPEGFSPVGPARVFNKTTGRIWDRHLYAFYRDTDGKCFAFSYNYANRTVFALRKGKWVPIGRAEGPWGSFRPFEGQDWKPAPE
jgi:hypothetical protein